MNEGKKKERARGDSESQRAEHMGIEEASIVSYFHRHTRTHTVLFSIALRGLKKKKSL